MTRSIWQPQEWSEHDIVDRTPLMLKWNQCRVETGWRREGAAVRKSNVNLQPEWEHGRSARFLTAAAAIDVHCGSFIYLSECPAWSQARPVGLKSCYCAKQKLSCLVSCHQPCYLRSVEAWRCCFSLPHHCFEILVLVKKQIFTYMETRTLTSLGFMFLLTLTSVCICTSAA